MLDDCENHSASCCEIRLEPSPILTKVSAAGVGTTPGEGPETQRTHCRPGEGASRRPEEDRRARKADHGTRKANHRTRKANHRTRKANHRLGTTARPAQEELHKLFQAPFLRWFGRRAKTARPQAQEPTETRRPARTPRASSPPDSHGRGERPKSAAAGTLPALRAKAAAKGRPSDNGGGATTASGDGDSGD